VALGWSVVAFILVPVPLFGIVAISQASGKSIIQVILKQNQLRKPCGRKFE
jgi:hypothetical protein